MMVSSVWVAALSWASLDAWEAEAFANLEEDLDALLLSVLAFSYDVLKTCGSTLLIEYIPSSF